MNAAGITYKIIYSGKDITKDISDHLLNLSYTDKVEGESDELSITMEDADALWQNAWYPGKRDVISAEIEKGGIVLQCGNFTIDQIELSGSRSGDTINISAMAAFVTKKLRTRRTAAHENKTLSQLANTIAERNGLSVIGIVKDVTIARVTQYRETDLHFLQGLANNYGYTFSIRDGKLVFTTYASIEGKSPILSIDKTDIISYSIKDKTSGTYTGARVRYHDPTHNKVVEGISNDDTAETSDDTLEIQDKAENQQQAELKAGSALHNANTVQQEGNVTLEFNPLLVSGVNFELTGIGQLSGIYHIVQSAHALSRGSGGETRLDIKRVGKIAASKFIPKAIGNQSSNSVKTN